MRPLLIVILLVCGSAHAQDDEVLYLMGRVTMEDGAPVPQSLLVELICDSRVIRQSNISRSGTFSFDLGSRKPTQPVTDARTSPTTGGLNRSFARSAWNSPGFATLREKVYLEDCLVRVSPTPGLLADEIKLGIRGLRDDPDIGEIIVRRASVPTSQTVSVTTAAAPAKALNALEQARQELSKSKPDHSKAARSLEKAVELYPEFSEAWFWLGKVREFQNKSKAARTAFEKSIAADALFLGPYIALAQLDLEQQLWDQAAQRARQILDLETDSPYGLFYKGLASYYLQRYPVSDRALTRLFDLGYTKDFPMALLHLGLLNARKNNIPTAAKMFRLYLEQTPEAQIPPQRRESINRQLRAWEEQGLTTAEFRSD